MGRVSIEFETEYNVGDYVAFLKDGVILVGRIEGYYVEDGCFWFNIRLNSNFVYTYSNHGDIAEFDILFKLTSEQIEKIQELSEDYSEMVFEGGKPEGINYLV